MEDDFAQSRGADDLFMDEFESPPNEPAGSYVEQKPVPQPSPKPAQLSGENLERHTQAHYDREYEAQKYRGSGTGQQNGGQNQQQNNQNGGRGGRRGRGRGRGGNDQNGARQQNNPLQQQTQQGALNPATTNTPLPAQPAPAATSPPDAATSPPEPAQNVERIDDTVASVVPPNGPAAQQHRIQAVRGDRTATGPPKPKKRTEAEITELMAKMKLKSSAAAVAHEKSKKDQELFEQREREAKREREEKQVKERQNVRAMDSERAKNAIRKQKAMQGREWDSEKQDSDIVDKSRGNASRYMKGANGGVARDVQPRKEVGERMEQAARAVKSVEEEFPALGAGMSGARGAAGRGGGLTAKQGGRELFPNGPGQPSARGGNNNRGAPRGGARGGGGRGLGGSRYADAAADAPKSDSKRSMNTDIRLEEAEQKKAAVKPQEKGDKVVDTEAGKKEFEELKKADEGKKMNWAEEANEAA